MMYTFVGMQTGKDIAKKYRQTNTAPKMGKTLRYIFFCILNCRLVCVCVCAF